MRTIGINLPKEDARVGGHAKDLRERQVEGGAAEDSRGALAEPSEIAEVIHFLCSVESRFISREGVNVNGGMLLN